MNRILVTLCLLACTAFAAEEKPAPPQNFTHRITGLFSPGRETALRTALEKVPGVALVSVDFEHAEGVFSYDPAIVFKGVKADDSQSVSTNCCATPRAARSASPRSSPRSTRNSRASKSP